jgi:hypothetical protein
MGCRRPNCVEGLIPLEVHLGHLLTKILQILFRLMLQARYGLQKSHIFVNFLFLHVFDSFCKRISIQGHEVDPGGLTSY